MLFIYTSAKLAPAETPFSAAVADIAVDRQKSDDPALPVPSAALRRGLIMAQNEAARNQPWHRRRQREE
jgi:hypothetical protein